MKRRGNGEGTIYKRKDGRWAAQTYVTLTNGRIKRICFSGANYQTVAEKLREARNKEAQRIPYAAKDWMVADYLDYWLEKVQKQRIGETTFCNHSSIIKNHLKPVLALHRYKIKTLSVREARGIFDDLRQSGCVGSTAQKCYNILSACLNYAMRTDELVFRNVLLCVDKPAYEPKETLIWTVEQAAHFLRTIKDHPYYPAFLLGLTLGMRRGEIMGLRYSDIDFENGQIHVRQQINSIDGQLKPRDLKTKNSRRTLPLTDSIRQAIIEHAQKRGVIIPEYSPRSEFTTQDLIVTSRNGLPLEPRNFKRIFDDLARKAELPQIKIHAMRHISATLLKDENVPDKDAQLFFGHANISTTKAIYQHATKSIQSAAVCAIEKRLLAA